jgi:hypothetical protein
VGPVQSESGVSPTDVVLVLRTLHYPISPLAEKARAMTSVIFNFTSARGQFSHMFSKVCGGHLPRRPPAIMRPWRFCYLLVAHVFSPDSHFTRRAPLWHG